MSDTDTPQGPYRFCPDCPFGGRTYKDYCPDCGAHFFGGDPQ